MEKEERREYAGAAPMRAYFACRIVWILSAIVAVSLSSYAMAGGIPKWVVKVPEDKEYLYFVGIKTSAPALEDGKRSAIKQAVTELVEHFEVRSKTRYYEKKTELETKLFDEIDSKSRDVTVRGALLKDWYFDRTEGGFDVYVLVQYPKFELVNEKQRAQNLLAEKISSVRRLLRDGVDAWGRGDLKAAYLAFADAINEANEMEDEGLHTEALGKLRELLQRIEIKAVSGNKRKLEAYRQLKEPLAVKVFAEFGGSEVPLKGIPVMFTVSGGEGYENVVFTDEKGIASYQALKMPSGEVAVTASPEIEGFLSWVIIPEPDMKVVDSYIEALTQKKAFFTLDSVVVKKNIRVSVSVIGENSGHVFVVEEELSATLAGAGYAVAGNDDNSKADIIVTGKVRAKKGNGNMGWTYSSHADGFIKAVDNATGKVIVQKNLSAVGFGEADDIAVANAVKKLSKDISGQLIERMVEGGD